MGSTVANVGKSIWNGVKSVASSCWTGIKKCASFVK